ncbi:MAG TPA: Asp-tRNA(Asn)/Glu-tRNA(Gln) amidotransferase subunit GatB, partial [Solirubrobacterales bacterium]|nr:Asp-tRNA(Asn)/Glu-tRNA(Gln) amidotransferase subunit GatB [Solirubrobacterales bacterium]
MADLEAVIGLEIHVQLATKTKMFCGCELSFGDEPNVHTCPVCLAHPGVLPVPNEQAIRYALQIGAALNCEIAPRSIFHRKNYFYPDSPKAYQISQYDIPICGAGRLGDVRIHRAHLEEDAAKTIHVGESGRIHGSDASLVDFNRGGTPLVEIVTEPDLRGAAEAAEWARLLRETVRQLGVSDVNMEEGSLRVDANVSVRPAGSEELGTKTELKNMNSFRFLQRGVEAELARQRELVEGGGTVEQETLHFDPASGSLTSLRSKEEAHDYRYFPEPDLVPLVPTEEMLREAREALPELPVARIARYEEMGVPGDVALTLASDPRTAGYFENVAEAADGIEPRVLANWVTGELAAALRQAEIEGGAADSRVSPPSLAALVGMVQEKKISHGSAKTVLAAMVVEGGDPEPIVEREGLAQMSDSGELEAIVEKAMAENADAVEKIRAGNGKAIGAIVGAVMRETKGRADGGEVNRIIQEKL